MREVTIPNIRFKSCIAPLLMPLQNKPFAVFSLSDSAIFEDCVEFMKKRKLRMAGFSYPLILNFFNYLK